MLRWTSQLTAFLPLLIQLVWNRYGKTISFHWRAVDDGMTLDAAQALLDDHVFHGFAFRYHIRCGIVMYGQLQEIVFQTEGADDFGSAASNEAF